MGKNDSIYNLIHFIKSNADWERILVKQPYSVNIKRIPKFPHYVMFSYSQIESDFTNPIVRVCRGSVLEIKNGEVAPVLVPFYKFGNYGEMYSDTIDWPSAAVQEKLDGSLIKLARVHGTPSAHDEPPDSDFLWTTNNSLDINATIPEITINIEEQEVKDAQVFWDLLQIALRGKKDFLKNIPLGWTFMFELTSPRNQLIIPYTETKLTLIGARDSDMNERNPAMVKELFNIPFDIPKVFPLRDIQSVMEYCNSIREASSEGVVICDKDFCRVKVKSSFYRSLKGLKGENTFTDKKLYEAMLDGSLDDIVDDWSLLNERYEFIKNKLSKYKETIFEAYEAAETQYEELGGQFKMKLLKRKFLEYVDAHYDAWLHPYLFEICKPHPSLDRLLSRIKIDDLLRENGNSS